MSEADARRAAKWLQEAFDGQLTDEAAEMLIAIARGSLMGPGDGWFHPARAASLEVARREARSLPRDSIPKEKFRGPEAFFARLDRNKDGRITADDLDWSDRNPYVQQGPRDALFRRMDPQGDGRHA
jgi:hypothetical protein